MSELGQPFCGSYLNNSNESKNGFIHNSLAIKISKNGVWTTVNMTSAELWFNKEMTVREVWHTWQGSPRFHQTICLLQTRQERKFWAGIPTAGCHRWDPWHHRAPRGQDRGNCACHEDHGPWHRWHWSQSPSCCLEHSYPPDFHNLQIDKNMMKNKDL